MKNFNVGDSVFVQQECGDLFENDFCGTVVSISRGLVQVSDQDGDIWDVNFSQVFKED